MDKRIHNKDKNIILYPGLVKRLIEKGMDALKAKDGEAAYQFFLHAEEHEPEHPQVLFGKMLSLVELGRLEEAVGYTNDLLREGIGDYYDNLQVHISLLVQLGKYQEVVDILDAVLSENRFPAQYAESFYQLLHFSRQMVGDQEWPGQIEPETIPLQEDIIHMLESTSVELQSTALTLLKDSSHPEAITLLIQYVEGENRDYALQSLALQALHDKDCSQEIHIKKGSYEGVVRPSEIDNERHESFGRRIEEALEARLEQEDPLLFEMAKHLSWSHMLSIYPFLPEPADEEFWSSVFYFCAAERMGIDNPIETETNLVQKNHIYEKCNEVKEIEAIVYQRQGRNSTDK